MTLTVNSRVGLAAVSCPTGDAPLLDVRGLRIAFDQQEVVHGIDFCLSAREKLALVGESGSGKTVSALGLFGLLTQARVAGTAHFLGQDLLRLPQSDLRALRGEDVAFVFQEPMTALNPLLTIGAQIAEVLTEKKGWSVSQAGPRVLQLLTETGLDDPARRALSYPHQLSGGQRQRAMIAMALASEPKLLVADEPTTALDANLRLQILELLDGLQQRNEMAVLIITHDLHLVRRFADRVAIMEQGHIVEQGAVAEVFGHPVHDYTRKLLGSRPVRVLDEVELPEHGIEARLQAKSLGVTYPVPLAGWRGWFGRGRFEAVSAVDCLLPAGRTLGVVGESGSGKSTLALAVLGLLPHDGSLHIMGESWASRDRTRLRALRQRVQVVFQDPYSSLSPRMTLLQVVEEGLRVHRPQWSAAQRRERVIEVLREVGLFGDLDAANQSRWLQRYMHEFSGGQRQRMAIARALIVEPDLLVLDEPTSALDVTVQKQVIELLLRLQREHGLSYLLITHDVEVVWALAHDVLVMQAGKVLEQGPARRVLLQPENSYTKMLLKASPVL